MWGLIQTIPMIGKLREGVEVDIPIRQSDLRSAVKLFKTPLFLREKTREKEPSSRTTAENIARRQKLQAAAADAKKRQIAKDITRVKNLSDKHGHNYLQKAKSTAALMGNQTDKSGNANPTVEGSHHISNLGASRGYNRKSVGSSHRINKDYGAYNKPIIITQGKVEDARFGSTGVSKKIESNMKHTTSTPGIKVLGRFKSTPFRKMLFYPVQKIAYPSLFHSTRTKYPPQH